MFAGQEGSECRKLRTCSVNSVARERLLKTAAGKGLADAVVNCITCGYQRLRCNYL
jgi:hypothetical protein